MIPEPNIVYIFLGWLGVVVVALSLIAGLAHVAQKRGEAEEKARQDAAAKKLQDEMTDVVMKPREPGETQKRLEDGTF